MNSDTLSGWQPQAIKLSKKQPPKKERSPQKPNRTSLGHYSINENALNSAEDDFNWGPAEIMKCLLKLNNRHYVDDKKKNHYYKTESHTQFPNTKMDYYKAEKIMEGFNIYTHFYISPSGDTLVISSFKEL